MNYAKMLFLSLILVNFYSCGKKKNESGGGSPSLKKSVNLQTDSDKDSDFDGVSDVEEVKMGSNPYIANIPIPIFENLELDFYNNEERFISTLKYKSSLEHLREKLAIELKNKSNQSVYGSSFFDFDQFNIACLHPKYKIPVASEIQLKIKANFDEKLQDLRLNSFNLNPNEEVSLSNIRLVNNCYQLEQLSFNYLFGGEWHNNNEEKEKFQKELTRVTIHTPEQNFEYFVTPGKLTISDLMKHSTITSLVESQFKVFSTNNYVSGEKLKKGTYSFVHLNKEEISQSGERAHFIKGSSSGGIVELEEVNIGDTISISLEADLIFSFPSKTQKYIPGGYYERGFHHRNGACLFEEYPVINNPDLANIQNNLALKVVLSGSKREFLLSKSNGRFTVSFRIQSIDEKIFKIVPLSQTKTYFYIESKWTHRGRMPGKPKNRYYWCNEGRGVKKPIIKQRRSEANGGLNIAFDLLHTTY